MNMIRYITIAAAMMLALAFTGCRHSDEPEHAAPVALVLSAAVYDIDAETSSVWHAGQEFGVYMLGSGRNPMVSNVRHLADNRGVTGYLVPEAAAMTFPTDGTSVDIAAYYPYDGYAADNGHRTTVAVRDGMAADAYLWADAAGASAAAPRVTLAFKSLLAQIRARILCADSEVARLLVRIDGAPRSCDFDVVNGCYTGTADCSAPTGVTVKVSDGAFDLSATVVAAESAEAGPVMTVTALDADGKQIRTYPPVALGALMGLDNGRTFTPNTVYSLAGSITAGGIDLQFTGKSPICILGWTTDPDEESGIIIKNKL